MTASDRPVPPSVPPGRARPAVADHRGDDAVLGVGAYGAGRQGPVDLTRAAWARDLPDTVEMIEVTARFTEPPQERRMPAQVTVCPYLVVVADLRRRGGLTGGFTGGFTVLHVPTGLPLPTVWPMSPWVAADAAARVADLDWSHPDRAYYNAGGPGAGHSRAWVTAMTRAADSAAADGEGLDLDGDGGL